MSINLTIQEAIEAKKACDVLSQKSFSAKTSFKLIKLLKELSSIEKTFNEIQNMTILKYASRDNNNEVIKEELEDGKVFIPIALENREKCNKELTEALEQEIEILDIFFDINEFGEELISPENLIGLYPFIIE